MAEHVGNPKQHILKLGSTPITTAAYIELDAALDDHSSEIEIYNTTTKILILAQGAAGSEDDMLYIPAAGNARMRLVLSKGARLAVKAVDANTAAGHLLINLWG